MAAHCSTLALDDSRASHYVPACDREFLRELGATSLYTVHPVNLAIWLEYKLNSVLSEDEMQHVEAFALRCREALAQ